MADDGRFMVAVAFVIERDGHVLLMKRSAAKDHGAGEWEVGSGRVQQGESPLAAVHREVAEETGLAVEIVGPLDTFHFYRGATRVETIGITFHCRAAAGAFTLSAEHDEARWVPMAELPGLDCGDWMRRAFAALPSARSR